MKNRKEKTVMLLVAVSLIMLISVQVYWARRNYNEAETVFTEKVNKALVSVRDEANDAATCFILYSKTYIDSGEGIYLSKSKWSGKKEEWNTSVAPDSLPMFFNIPEEHKTSPLNRVYKDVKFSNP